MVRSPHDLARRDFLRACSAGLALLPALGAHGLAQVLGPRRSRVAVVRTWMMNHLIHHRAQLCVYLRLRDVPVPALYGPSADEVN